MYTEHSESRFYTKRVKKTSFGECGFTLLELMVCLVIMCISATVVSSWAVKPILYHNLNLNSDQVVWTMRWTQQQAITHATDTNFRFSPYTPEYATYLGASRQSRASFPAGVQYKDGYLQVATGNIRYSSDGSSQVSGIIQFVAGPYEATIKLYMTSGIQVFGGSS